MSLCAGPGASHWRTHRLPMLRISSEAQPPEARVRDTAPTSDVPGPRLRITISAAQQVHLDQGASMNVIPFARLVALLVGSVALAGLLVAFPLRIAGATR